MLVPTVLGSEVFEMLLPKKDTFFPKATARVPLNDDLWLLPGHVGFLVSGDQQARRRITFLARAIGSDYQEAIGLLEQEGNPCETQVIHIGIY